MPILIHFSVHRFDLMIQIGKVLERLELEGVAFVDFMLDRTGPKVPRANPKGVSWQPAQTWS